MTERGGKTGPLFKTDEKKRRIAALHICEVVRWAGIRASLNKPMVPKMLRHSFATHLIDRGVDIGVIAMLMGHKSPKETGVYLHALKGRKEDAVKKLSVEGGDDDDVEILVDSLY